MQQAGGSVADVRAGARARERKRRAVAHGNSKPTRRARVRIEARAEAGAEARAEEDKGAHIADGLVGLLRLLRRGGDASANGPDGLVRDDDLSGVHHALDRGELLDALGEDGVNALLADRQRLANGEDDLQALLERVGALGAEELVGLGGRGQAKLAAALGVADEDPLDAHVDHLVGGHLASVGAAAGEVHVLGGDLGTLGELAHRDVERRRADIDVTLGRVARLNVGHELRKLGGGRRVALPVATHDRAARHEAAGGAGSVHLRA